MAQAAIGLVRKLIHEHKRIIFDGDNYSTEWHEEAKRRGLPILQDSVEAFPVLNSKKTADLFKKYGVLNKAEVDSRYHIAVEKWVKQLGIEADTMGVMARTLILPAALEHQRRTAEALAATTGAGVEDKAGKAELTALVKLISEFREAIDALEAEAAVEHADPMAHARHIKAKVKPAMAEVRRLGDLLQLDVAADLWPMPVYRELLFLK